MLTKIYIYVLMTIALFFLLSIIRRTPYIPSMKSRFYRLATYILIIILISYALREVAIEYNQLWLSILVNIVIYGSAPFLPYSLCIASLQKFKKIEILHAIPAIIIAILSIISPFTGILFITNQTEIYRRGPLCLMAFGLIGLYAVEWVYLTFVEYAHVKVKDKIHLGGLYSLAVIGTALQILEPQTKSCWPAIALVILLYYAFIIEVNGRFDDLTKLENRKAYYSMLLELEKAENYSLVVFDINSLKLTNDQLGHEKGDLLISETARLIRQELKKTCHIYRLGGDEFCAISLELTPDELEKKCHKVTDNLKASSEKYGFRMSVSYGVVSTIDHPNVSYDDLFKIADEKMYTYKQWYYKENNLPHR